MFHEIFYFTPTPLTMFDALYLPLSISTETTPASTDFQKFLDEMEGTPDLSMPASAGIDIPNFTNILKVSDERSSVNDTESEFDMDAFQRAFSSAASSCYTVPNSPTLSRIPEPSQRRGYLTAPSSPVMSSMKNNPAAKRLKHEDWLLETAASSFATPPYSPKMEDDTLFIALHDNQPSPLALNNLPISNSFPSAPLQQTLMPGIFSSTLLGFNSQNSSTNSHVNKTSSSGIKKNYKKSRSRSVSFTSSPSLMNQASISGHIQQFETPRSLNVPELQALFLAANQHPNTTRCKRDTVILCFLLDLHFSSGQTTKLTFGNVRSIIGQNGEWIHDRTVLPGVPYFVETPSDSHRGLPVQTPCHPITVWALRIWVEELVTQFGWDVSDDRCPIFVNSQPISDPTTGRQMLRQIALKRDAISKVFQAVKTRSGVTCHKNMVPVSNLSAIGNSWLEWVPLMEHYRAKSSVAGGHDSD